MRLWAAAEVLYSVQRVAPPGSTVASAIIERAVVAAQINALLHRPSAAALPPDDPPGENSSFHGLRVTPHSRLCVNPAQLNSGVAVRMWMIPPACWIRSMIG